MSGGEPSSIKRFTRCAVRVPALSRSCENHVGVTFDKEVYGLILQLDFLEVRVYASGFVSEMASADL